MNDNKINKILSSLPVILVTLYFIPLLGVCLILFRYYIYRNKKYYNLPIILIILGMVILVPKIIDSILNVLKLNKINVFYLNSILNSDLYLKFLKYSKTLISVGVIFLILVFIIKAFYNKVSDMINHELRDYMNKDLQKDYEIRKANDFKMQEKREKAKNTHIVHCSYCGAENVLTEKIGVCKYCRRQIEFK